MVNESRLIVGAMSGTSADGVDVALVRITGRAGAMAAKMLHHHFVAYDGALRRRIFQIRGDAEVALKELAALGRDISLTYARAVNEALAAMKIASDELSAVAAHGQTLYHAPPDTIQWLDPALIASEIGCTIISDFRRADCAAGGQGAPLVPFADHVLFTDPMRSRVLINLGGIANLTYLPAHGTLEQLIAFDTGPGNCISDELMRELHPEGNGIDTGGALASHGRADDLLVLRMLNDADGYFVKPPPKSTDGPAMIKLFREVGADAIRGRATLPDTLATACLLTAASIGRAMRTFLPEFPDEVYVSGGGTMNGTMLRMLRDQLGGRPLRLSDELGVPSAAKEAVAFALLGAATLDGEPGNVRAATGARHAVVLGSVTPKPFNRL